MHAPQDLHRSDKTWAVSFAEDTDSLAVFDDDQQAFWPIDDLIAKKTYVPCPERGTHARLVECWMCFCDVAYGHATADEVLAAGEL